MKTAELIAWAVAAGIAGALLYGAACFIWPYGDCRWCSGSGSKRSPSKKYRRPCRHCKGSGTRIRLGRRVWTKLGIAKNKLVG